MKSDQEFLDDMWLKVELMEDKLVEKEEVRLRTKKLIVKKLIISSIFILLSLTLFLLNLYTDYLSTYLTAFLVMGVAYIIEEINYTNVLAN